MMNGSFSSKSIQFILHGDGSFANKASTSKAAAHVPRIVWKTAPEKAELQKSYSIRRKEKSPR